MDQRILQGCRAGEPHAIETLVRESQGAVYRVCLSILNDPSDAEDATQETFIAALKALPGFRGDSAFSTWLYAIAVNNCRRLLKQRKRTTPLNPTYKTGAPAFADPAPDPELTVIHSEVAQALWHAVTTLDEAHRLPVILRYYHELPIAEIAVILEISEGTVHSRLFNARERMRGLIKVREALFKDRKGARR
jgi:RNA polymerase sigma-70 factor (ECF subfamily)